MTVQLFNLVCELAIPPALPYSLPPCTPQVTVGHQAEVPDLDDPLGVGGEVDVGGLEVPVDQAHAVHVFHSHTDLAKILGLAVYNDIANLFMAGFLYSWD